MRALYEFPKTCVIKKDTGASTCPAAIDVLVSRSARCSVSMVRVVVLRCDHGDVAAHADHGAVGQDAAMERAIEPVCSWRRELDRVLTPLCETRYDSCEVPVV